MPKTPCDIIIECKDCKHKFEITEGFAYDGGKIVCPNCNSDIEGITWNVLEIGDKE